MGKFMFILYLQNLIPPSGQQFCSIPYQDCSFSLDVNITPSLLLSSLSKLGIIAPFTHTFFYDYPGLTWVNRIVYCENESYPHDKLEPPPGVELT